MSEHEDEPVRGLPERLPAGEHILWQGAPDWRTLARTGMHTHAVAIYFGLMLVVQSTLGAAAGETANLLAARAGWLVLAAAISIGLLTLYAWLSARTTVYTLTSKRFVVRHGVALSKIFNIPYGEIAAADLKTDAKGFGDIPIRLAQAKIAYPHLWPHVRPFRFVNPQPMMRAIPEAALVAGVLGRALAAAATASDRSYVVNRPEAAPAAARPSAMPQPA